MRCNTQSVNVITNDGVVPSYAITEESQSASILANPSAGFICGALESFQQFLCICVFH